MVDKDTTEKTKKKTQHNRSENSRGEQFLSDDKTHPRENREGN